MDFFKDLPEYDKSVLLAFNNETHRGPGMVAKNLQEGLRRIGVYVLKPEEGDAKYKGYLQPSHPGFLNSWVKNNQKVLMGPNLFVLPTDSPELCKGFTDFVVPGQWVKDKYKKFDLLKEKNIHVWPVGIDTDEWSPVDKNDEQKFDCLIYHKNRGQRDLAVTEAICRKYNLSFKTLKYGEYDENDLKITAPKSKFAILVNGTESQGIAYMQILSTNTPCYVFNKTSWTAEDKSITVPATSIPYWDERCGSASNDVDLKHFEEFLEKLNTFSPREYILENHTLEKSAKKYYNLLRIMNSESEVSFE